MTLTAALWKYQRTLAEIRPFEPMHVQQRWTAKSR
jgi:hypothetical protein